MKALRIILPLFAVLSIYSCTERIELELNDDNNRRLVVDAWFTSINKQHEVRLTETTSYYAPEEAPKVSGAVVKITGPDVEETLIEEEPGVYRTSSIAGTIGNTYTLTIEHDGETYEASGFMRDCAPIDAVMVEFEEAEGDVFDFDGWYVVHIDTQELPGLGDDYMWLTYINGEPLRDTLSEIVFVTDQFYDGLYIEEADIEYLESPGEASAGDVVRIEQLNIGRAGFEVLNGIMNETQWNGGLFDAPPANVATNISGGALGFFGVAGAQDIAFTIPE